MSCATQANAWSNRTMDEMKWKRIKENEQVNEHERKRNEFSAKKVNRNKPRKRRKWQKQSEVSFITDYLSCFRTKAFHLLLCVSLTSSVGSLFLSTNFILLFSESLPSIFHLCGWPAASHVRQYLFQSDFHWIEKVPVMKSCVWGKEKTVPSWPTKRRRMLKSHFNNDIKRRAHEFFEYQENALSCIAPHWFNRSGPSFIYFCFSFTVFEGRKIHCHCCMSTTYSLNIIQVGIFDLIISFCWAVIYLILSQLYSSAFFLSFFLAPDMTDCIRLMIGFLFNEENAMEWNQINSNVHTETKCTDWSNIPTQFDFFVILIFFIDNFKCFTC